jgi:hypothetical protein|tara:strand:+ start:32 stop:520 length:489 start_codon:yes stop_codon:yes gene_type:complete
MASTITAGTLKVTLTEQIILNGRDQGSKNTLSISSIKDVFKRIITIAADDDATVLVFKSTTAIADGALDLQNVKYIRITNLDDTNSVGLSLQLDSDEDNSAANESCTILLEAGRSFIMGTPDEGIHVNDDAAGILTALTDLESIIINPGANAGTVEVFTASA